MNEQLVLLLMKARGDGDGELTNAEMRDLERYRMGIPDFEAENEAVRRSRAGKVMIMRELSPGYGYPVWIKEAEFNERLANGELIEVKPSKNARNQFKPFYTFTPAKGD